MKRSPILNRTSHDWPDPLTIGTIRFITTKEPDTNSKRISDRTLITVCHNQARKFTVYANYDSWNEAIGTYEAGYHYADAPTNDLKRDFAIEDIPLTDHEWVRVQGWMQEQFDYANRRQS